MTNANKYSAEPYQSPPPGRVGRSAHSNLNSGRAALTGSLDKLAILALFIIFLWGISRIGIAIVPEFTNIAWLGAYGATALAILRRPNIYLALIRHNVIFIIAPLFCILSALWSFMPSLSAYSGTLVLLNALVGFAIAERLGIVRAIIVLFFYYLVVQGLSLVAVVLHIGWAHDLAGQASGLYLHKNAMAQNSVVFYLTALVLFASGWRRSLSGPGILMALAGLYLTRSGTGLLLGAFTTAVLIASTIAAPGNRLSLFFGGLFLVVASMGVALLLLAGIDVETGVLDLLGKDATFTGRTILWDEALRSAAEHPWLGIGYNAFWNSPDTAAASIWMAMRQRLMSFHNIYMDRLVDVGGIGCALFVGVLAILLWRSGRRFLSSGAAIDVWPFAFVCFIAVDGLAEFPVFWNSEFQLMLSVVAAATCGVRLNDGAEALRE